MLAKRIKSLILTIIVLFVALFIYHYRKNAFIRLIKNESLSEKNLFFTISGEGKKISNLGDLPTVHEKMTDNFKLIYNMNFECSRCLAELKEVQRCWKELAQVDEIDLCIVTSQIDLGLARFYLDRSLKEYEIWVICQKLIRYREKVYLIDGSNRIVIKGDIIEHPFLRDEFVKQFIMSMPKGKTN